jgi:hypothetical protein
MPMVPREQREQYRKWAKANDRTPMDKKYCWVQESDYSDFARSCRYCGWVPGSSNEGCRVCDNGYYG